MNNPWLKKDPSLGVGRSGVAPSTPSPRHGAERQQTSDAAATLLMNDLVGLWLQTLAPPQRERSSRRSMRH
jgi:hypothetical protein